MEISPLASASGCFPCVFVLQCCAFPVVSVTKLIDYHHSSVIFPYVFNEFSHQSCLSSACSLQHANTVVLKMVPISTKLLNGLLVPEDQLENLCSKSHLKQQVQSQKQQALNCASTVNIYSENKENLAFQASPQATVLVHSCRLNP